MNSIDGKRNFVSMEKFFMTVLIFAVVSDAFTKRDVIACPKGQKCMTIPECRKINRQAQSSLLYPCDETLKGSICCAVKPVEEEEEEDPGYTITYGDSPQPSEPIPVPLPLRIDATQKSAETCGLYHKGEKVEDASILQFPWLALIGNNDVGTIQFHCGGTLINYRYVLTSASCINNMISTPDVVRLGEYDMSKGDDCEVDCKGNGTPIDSEIEKIVVHESYDYPLMKNDIALLRLKDSLPKDKENIMPICLPTKTVTSEVYTVAGWGVNDQRNFSTTPKYGLMSLDSPDVCEPNLAIPLQPVGEKQLCSRKIVGSCYGDRGGPLMAYIKKDNKETAILAGIISHRSPKCNSPFTTDLFTNVASYLDWIAENMK